MLELIHFKFIHISGCNDNPTALQFKGAYRKLMVHNEVENGVRANCFNDITKVLEVSSSSNRASSIASPDELEMLRNFDFENGEDEYLNELYQNSDILQQNSTAYIASIVEEKVIKKLTLKGRKGCMNCANVFVENEITDDIFIQFKSKNSKVIPPCKDTIVLIQNIDNLLERYESQNVTFNSMLVHISGKIDTSNFYESTFGSNHNHKNEFISLIIRTYMDVKSTNMCKMITRMSQDKQIRHSYLKEIHFRGQ